MIDFLIELAFNARETEQRSREVATRPSTDRTLETALSSSKTPRA